MVHRWRSWTPSSPPSSTAPSAENYEPTTDAMTCRSSCSTRIASASGRAFLAPPSPGALLKSTPAKLRGQPVYAYIVTTIKTTTDYQLIQEGSAPNFDGERITLCTC